MKFGIFIHWGAYSVPSYVSWCGRGLVRSLVHVNIEVDEAEREGASRSIKK
jgi:hypothetical protein